MNKHILFVIDHQLNPDKYTQVQLKDNYKVAYTAKDAFTFATNAAFAANATFATYTGDDIYAADSAHWVNEYFELTGESKQDYINEINKDNKQ